MRDQRRRYDSTRRPGGHIHSEAIHIQEHFHRRDFGHMDMEVTVDDPVTPTKPANREFTEVLIPNSDILEYFCAEGERDAAAIDGDPPTLLITYSGRDPANMIKSLPWLEAQEARWYTESR
jgi:hypothetical protein